MIRPRFGKTASGVAVLTEDNFETELTGSKVPVVVDFWAPWCAPCRIMGPILEELALETGPGIKIAKMDVGANPRAAESLNISSVPCIAVFVKGKMVKETIGVMPKEAVKLILKEFL